MRTVASRLFVFAVIAMMAGSGALVVHHASADVDGTTYTSPTYGYTISWPAGWQVGAEYVDPGTDFLSITDGVTAGQFIGGPFNGGPPQETLSVLFAYFSSLEGVSNVVPLTDAEGVPISYADDARAYSAYSFTITSPGIAGYTYDEVGYFGVETAAPGIQVAIILDTIIEKFEPVPGGFNSVLTSISINGEPLPPLETDLIAAATGGGATAGEPAPVIADGPWRFAVAATTIGESIPSLSLKAKEGHDWIVVIADVTNWSSADGVFSLRDPLVQTAQMDEAGDIAPASTEKVAGVLGLETQDRESADIAAGGLSRVALVYSVPTGATAVQLHLGDAHLVLDPYVDPAFDPEALPAAPAPPTTVQGPIFVTMIKKGIVTVGVEGVQDSYTLIGVEVPDCVLREAGEYLTSTHRAFAFIEPDPAMPDAGEAYIWVENADGTRTLLNQQLLENGHATTSAIPDSARFADWLQSTEAAAQEAESGLWATC